MTDSTNHMLHVMKRLTPEVAELATDIVADEVTERQLQLTPSPSPSPSPSPTLSMAEVLTNCLGGNKREDQLQPKS